MKNKYIILILGIVLLATAFAVPWSPQGNVDLQKYWNMTNLSYFEGFTLKGNITGVGYNISADNFTGDLNWTYLWNYPSACSTGYAVTQIGDTTVCTRFVLGTGDSITGAYNIEGTLNISNGTGTALLITGNIDLNFTSATNHLLLPLNNDATTPSLAFGDGDTGFYESADDNLVISLGGTARWLMASDLFRSNTANYGAVLKGGAGSSTVPVFIFEDDQDTGIGRAAADQLSLIAGGGEFLRVWNDTISGGVIIAPTIQNNASYPSLSFGDGDTGFFEGGDDQINVALLGAEKFGWAGNLYKGLGTSAAGMKNEVASASNPTFTPNKDDPDTGIGWNGADILSLIAGAVQGIRITETSNLITILLNGTTTINGDLNITGTIFGGRAGGEMYIYDNNGATTINTQFVFENITINMTSGILDGFTHSAGVLTVPTADVYEVIYSASFSGAGANENYWFTIGIGGETQDKCTSARKVGAGGDVGNIGGNCELDLILGQEITLMVSNQDATNNPTIVHANIDVEEV